MGTWGVGILDSDEACDYRDDYLHLRQKGLTPASARDALAINYQTNSRIPDQTILWLALAATQLERNELEAEVRDKALSIIEQGADLEVWQQTAFDMQDVSARRQILNQLAAELRAPNWISTDEPESAD